MLKKVNKKPETIISVAKDSYTTDHAVLFSSYALNKFSLTFEGLKIKYKDSEKVIKKILEYDKTIKRLDFPISIFYDFYVLENDKYLLTFDSMDNKKRIEINFYFHTYEESKDIFDIIQSFQDKDDDLFVSVSSFFFNDQKQIKVNELIKNKEDFESNSLDYYPYIDTEEMFSQFMMSDSNILLLSGNPGVGKTRLGDAFMKYLLEKADIKEISSKTKVTIHDEELVDEVFYVEESQGVKVAYIKNEEILSQDIFWNILQEEEFNLVFLDDLDYSLLPRTQNISTSEDIQKNKFISNLLSFTDGIFDAGNKTKLIITTNKEVGDIDTAVLRKGRTFDILQLRELHNQEARKIWLSNGLPEKLFDEKFQDSVLQADLGTTINIEKKALENNIELKPYIQEDGISLYNKTKSTKKIGL